jgi:hypothetical protein
MLAWCVLDPWVEMKYWFPIKGRRVVLPSCLLSPTLTTTQPITKGFLTFTCTSSIPSLYAKTKQSLSFNQQTLKMRASVFYSAAFAAAASAQSVSLDIHPNSYQIII